jgi:hypothetical protein
MNVIGGHHIVEHRKAEAFLGFENPMQVTATVISIGDGSSLAFFPKRLERSVAIERLERLELTAV